MISSCYGPELLPSGKINHKTKEKKLKPECILQYNLNMGAVDKTDMLQSSIESVRKNVKWYKKVFFHLIDLCLLNAHVIYKMKTGQNIPIADFQVTLVKQLLEKYHKTQVRLAPGRKTPEGDSPLRLTGRHFPSFFPNNTQGKPVSKRCVVCSKNKKRREVRFECDTCNVARHVFSYTIR